MSSSSNKGPKKPPAAPPPISISSGDSDKPAFDSDFEKTGVVPSITKLLKRKSFQKQSDTPAFPVPDFTEAKEPSEKLPGTKLIEIHAIPQEPLPPSPEISGSTTNPADFVERLPEPVKAAPEAKATAKPAKRAHKEKAAPLAVWNWAQLQTNADPLALTLAWLKNKDIHGALFLAMRIENKLPFFVATACIDPKERLGVWDGIRWDPRIAPDLWNIFVRGGYVEATPPGTDTYIGSARNLLRNAFGVGGEDILTLVRVGPLNQCRGVLALVSRKSLIPLMPDVLRRLRSI